MDDILVQNAGNMLVDLISGDDKILTREDFNQLDPSQIKKALDFLMKHPGLDDKQKVYLAANSWRINYRDKPPTPENFISEKYLGPVATHTYDRVKKTFIEFMDPTKPYRDAILYPAIGWGKSYWSGLMTLYIGVHLSMMRAPYKYFGLNPAAVLTQLLISYSLKKSSELLLEPMIAMLETSPFFEKVHTREGMIKKDRDFQRQNTIDRIYWTTAVPTSAIQMSNGANVKLASSPASILGLSVVSGILSEISFFRDAGKALAMDTLILMVDGSSKKMEDVEIGDFVKHPTLGETEVIGIPWEGIDDCYEIELEDGRSVQCNANHLWPVTYTEKGIKIEKVVTTQFMIENPTIGFLFKTTDDGCLLNNIQYIGRRPQRCITVGAQDGLFVLANNIITHNSDDYVMRVYNDTKTRVYSRMRGNYFGRTVLDSSPNTLDSPIDDYVVNHARKSEKNYVISGPNWEWTPEDYDLTKTFKVYVGGKGQPPKILDEFDDENAYSPEKLSIVPFELKQQYEDDLYKALKDLSGIPAGSADMLIYDHSKIDNIFNPKLKNLYTHIKATEHQNPYRLIWDQVAHLFFKERAGKIEFWYKPWIPRCVSVDQSISGDVTCIAMTHHERIRESEEQMFVVDFVIPIAPMGERINLDAIRMFIEDLRDVGNMYIPYVSFDKFESESSQQYLRNKGFNAEHLSVDMNIEHYLFLLGLINRGLLVSGRNLYIKNNLKSLKIVSSGKGKTKKSKVDHDDSRPVVTTGTDDWNRSLIGAYAKDATDAIAASVALNKIYFPVATDFWEESYLDSLNDTSKQRKNAEDNLAAFMSKLGVV